ncbi:glycoside hydrolase family 127 protein [Microbacterium panaciterrae]|uniref:Glycoside hydrolase family 127 protein n=1 Tax=Microbacterium panaciterrae TaxID=985759 RepID=A0ABP8P5N9_9MICO
MTDMPSPHAAPTGLRIGGPVVPSRSLLRPLSHAEVRIVGGFWGERQDLNGSTIIDHCLTWMERIGWIGNFDRAVQGTVAEDHAGVEFVDSEVYKLLEAMAWEIGRSGEAGLEERYRSIVRRVAAAQDADGYLHTSFGRAGQRERYSDMEWGHELYCFGHLMQAAVARIRTGHDDLLVDVARRLADHVHREFGPDGRDAICGHPEIETALIELGRALGEDRYVDLAELFLERRGRRTLRTTLFLSSEYFLDDEPMREAEILRGHAVRAVYFASGAVDLAVERGDAELLAAVRAQWAGTVGRRMYVTGGIGAHHQNEEFGEDYELPDDRAYAETCAAIGSVMLNWRLLLQTGAAEYADLIERTLLNAVLVSPRADGRAFYYSNTLHQRVLGSEPEEDELSERAEASLRAPWFEVSCCPTNVARTLASVAGYFATADHDGVQIHQYADLDIDTHTGSGIPVSLQLRTGYPFDGGASLTVLSAGEFTLRLRAPGWAKACAATIDGVRILVVDGYFTLARRFEAGDLIRLEFEIGARVIAAHPRVDAARGAVALERGPLVLALESVDLPPEVALDDVRLDLRFAPEVTADGARVHLRIEPAADAAGLWPYRPQRMDTVADPAPRLVEAEVHPYFAWANRGPSLMRVWIPTAG